MNGNGMRSGTNGSQKLRELLDDKLANLGRQARDEIFVERRAEPEEQMELLAAVDMAAGQLNREAELRRQVREALERITRGTYGVCELCHEMISERRLEAVPWARMCRMCQEQADEAGTIRGGTLQ
ncbi:MAG: TraR/DksA C4-type zinc finger protein [Bryobacteraceae bacterium]